MKVQRFAVSEQIGKQGSGKGRGFIDESDFRKAGIEYRGTDLWMLNSRLEESELERQIEEMKEKGCGSFIARTYRGLKSDYPGEDFMRKMKVIIGKAKETGLKVFLQAGYMPGGVPDLPPEYTHKVIKAATLGKECGGEKNTPPNIPPERIIAKTKDRIYFMEPVKYYLDLLNPDAVRHYMKISYADIWERFASEFGKTIVSIWVDEPHFNPPFLPWTKELPPQFKEMWGYAIEDRLDSLFEDKGDSRSIRYHYWRTVLHLFKNAYFKEVSGWCRQHSLKFSGHLMGEDTFERQISFSASVMPLYKYMDIPGIDHLTNSMEWPRGAAPGNEGAKFLLTPLQCVSAAHQAGRDDILCEMYGVSTQDITFARQKYIFDYFVSLGINRKCVHAMFYSMKGERKRFYAPHMFYQQPWWEHYRQVTDYCARVTRFMKSGRPMSEILVLNPVESAFSEYRGSVSIGESGSIFESKNAESEIARMNKAFADLLWNMLGMQLAFDLADEDTLSECGSVPDRGVLKVGGMEYRIAIVPDFAIIRGSTLGLLKHFAQNGGTVIVKGRKPDLVDGRPDEKLLEFFVEGNAGVMFAEDIGELKALLRKLSSSDYSFYSDEDCSSAWINMRTVENGRISFIFNSDEKKGLKGILSLKGAYMVREWDAGNGSVREADFYKEGGSTFVRVCLEPGESIMLSLEKITSNAVSLTSGPSVSASESESPESVEYIKPVLSIRLDDRWNIKRIDPNAMVLEFCKFRKGRGEYSQVLPVLAVQQILAAEEYKGPVTLRFDFEVFRVPENIKLAVEEPEEYCFEINGRPLAAKKTGEYYKDRSFEVIDISGSIKEGLNTVEATRHFEPKEKPLSTLISLFQNIGGVELESMYLIGDFGVYGLTEPTNTGFIRFGRRFSIGAEKSCVGSEITIAGYPFYSGTVLLSKTIFVDEIPENKRAFLKVDTFNACVGIARINGIHAGSLGWKSNSADITGMLTPGGNKIEIELANTLRNLLGPYHLPQGELPQCWSNSWTGDYDIETGKRNPFWYINRVPDSKNWTDSYMQKPFGISGVRIDFGYL